MFGPCTCGCCTPPNWVCIPVPPTPPPVINPPALNGPIRGDISGNPAQPGNVGEFQQRSVTGSLTVAANANQITTVTPLSLPPGDWDVSASLTISRLFSGASFVLNPTIPGASGNMYTSLVLAGAAGAASITTETIVAQRAQLVSNNTNILQFDIDVTNTTASSVSGNYTFTINARRMR